MNTSLFIDSPISTIHTGDFTYFDIDSFAEFFEESGFFKVEKSIYIPYTATNISLDGREIVGAIMVKK